MQQKEKENTPRKKKYLGQKGKEINQVKKSFCIHRRSQTTYHSNYVSIDAEYWNIGISP